MAVMELVAGGEEEMGDKERRERLLRTYSAICEESFQGVPEISSEELLQILGQPGSASSVVLVDCRSEAEQSVSMFPGAVAMVEVEANLDKFKDLELIPYCAIGRRSGHFTKRMLEQDPGLKIRNHKGGILDWTHVQGPLVERTTQQPILRVHAGGAYHLKHLPTNTSSHLQILLPPTH